MTRAEYIIDDDDFLDDETKMSAESQGFLLGLIRCKDCKWYYRGGATCMYWDGENGMRGDDYCSQAERKEE